MTVILVQPELQAHWLACLQASTTISGMARDQRDAKRGPYFRKPKAAGRPPSNFIRQWRERAEMTQEDLADASGLSVGSISAYELGGADPSIDALKRLAAALGVTPGMLLDVNPEDDPPLWAGFLRATKGQKEEIGRIVGALVGPPKPKR